MYSENIIREALNDQKGMKLLNVGKNATVQILWVLDYSVLRSVLGNQMLNLKGKKHISKTQYSEICRE